MTIGKYPSRDYSPAPGEGKGGCRLGSLVIFLLLYFMKLAHRVTLSGQGKYYSFVPEIMILLTSNEKKEIQEGKEHALCFK